MSDAYRGASTLANRVNDEVEEKYRRRIALLDPNGSVPILGFMSMMPKGTTNSVVHHWWEKKRSTRSGDATVYIDSNLANGYTFAAVATNGQAGHTVFAKVAAELAAEFRYGHLVRLIDKSDFDVGVQGRVQNVVINGGSSAVEIILDETDDNADTPAAGASMESVDTILLFSDSHAENAEGPPATTYRGTKRTNYCQTLREALQMSRRDMVQKIRTDQDYYHLKTEKWQKHMENIERALIHGIPKSGSNTDESGDALTQMAGMIHWIRTYASSNVVNFTTDTDYSGQSWLGKGMTWIDKILHQVGLYGSDRRHAYIGYKTDMALTELAQAYHTINVKTGKNSFGQIVTRWEISGLQIDFKQHPLFNATEDMQNLMLLIDPENVKFITLEGGDTRFKTDPNTPAMLRHLNKGTAGQLDIDGIREEFLTDCSLQIDHPDTHMLASGFGKDSAV